MSLRIIRHLELEGRTFRHAFRSGHRCHRDAQRMRGHTTMPPRRDFFVDREPATTLPLFKFLLVVGALLTVGLIAIGSSLEPAASGTIEAGAKKRPSAAVDVRKP